MSSANSSLRPAWRNQSGGRGFQPPPSVAAERARSQSMGSAGENSGGTGASGTYNKFSALDDEDDEGLESSGGGPPSVVVQPKGNSRSEALRQGLGPRNTSSGANKPSGRRLADLAAQSPTPERPAGGAARFTRNTSTGAGAGGPPAAPPLDEGKIIRFTREKLLSMRPAPSNKLPEVLKPLEGNIILSEEPQDPVCWDTFDAEEIWATVPRRPAKPAVAGRSLADMAGEGPVVPVRGTATGGLGARRDGGSSAGRWQRGVALPPPSATDGKPRKERDAENPNELWDDPVSGAAAGDFSAFGDVGRDEEEEMQDLGEPGVAAFDFEKMAEESRLLEEELHQRSRASSEATDQESTGADDSQTQLDNGGHVIPAVKKTIDPHRPLASMGTTIRSGSGDDVNVFEDFDEPMSSDSTPTAVDPVSSETPKEQDVSAPPNNKDSEMDATSRLMAMIGVPGPGKADPLLDSMESSKPDHTALDPEQHALSAAWGVPPSPSHMKGMDGISIPLNPWGGPLLPGAGGLLPGGSLLQPVPSSNDQAKGLDLQARLREADMEQKAREDEMARRRIEQLEAQKRAAEMQQQQQQVAAARQQQQAGVQNQVELVLMERISNILETSWGRSDLVSILTTLHSEDSRVIALLNTIEALRALIMRHSSRVQLRHDPSFGAEMAILVLTNSQWQQQQAQAQQQAAQQEALLRARRQEEEMRRREQQRLEEERAAAAAAAALQNQPKPIIPGAPWFYSDPQQNIQGPFRAEEMRQWFEAGYFKGDLPISQDPNGPFRPLQKIYPDLSIAFAHPDDNMNQSMNAAEEEERRQQEEYESEKQRIAEARAAARDAEERRAREVEEAEQRAREAEEEAERERMEMAAAHAEADLNDSSESPDQSNGGNESSAQLKMMLGLSGQMQQQQASSNDDIQRDEAPPKRKDKKKSAKATQSQAPASVSPEAQPKPAASAWGATVAPKVSTKSMSEIQQEEARLAAIQTMQRERAAPVSSGSSGWANVAAVGSKTAPPPAAGWTAASAAKLTPVVATTKPGGPLPKPAQARKQSTGGSRAQVANVATSNLSPGKQQAGGGSPTVADDFGAKMSPALEKWGKEQMMKLNGTEDLTLLAFCMTLKDPNEIRQYFVITLGASPQVNNFANEFIARKVGVKPTKQEEWETTVPGKKKGKKTKVTGR